MEQPHNNSPPCGLEAPDNSYQTDSAPATGYGLSRWNACRWQTRRNDIRICRGTQCPYRDCNLKDESLPDLGTPCIWETWFATKLAEGFEQRFPREGIGRYLDDWDGWCREFMMAHILSRRAGARASAAFHRCVEAMENRGNMPIDRRPFNEHALAARYRAAALNRLQRVQDQLPVIEQRIRDERIRQLLVAHGHWKPQENPKPPEVVPEWIIRMVDGTQ